MQNINVLLVDDYPENLTALEAALSPLSYNLVKATSGKEALKWVLKEDFALILIDVQMPELDGFETARLIKSREKSKDIPIVFLTAINQALEHVHKGYDAGGIDYIFKPYNPDILLKKVKSLVQIQTIINTVQEQSKLLHAISEASIDTLITMDQRGIILSVNSALQKMFGYNGEEIVGEKIIKLLPEFLPDPKTQLYPRNLECEKVKSHHIEGIGRSKTGRIFPVEISIGEAQTTKHKVLVLTIRDITERKSLERERHEQYEWLEKLVEYRTRQIMQAHKKLSSSEKRFRTIFELSPNLMSIRSLKTGRYILVNPAWEKCTEYCLEEVKERDMDIYRFVDVSLSGESILSYLSNQPLRDVRITYITKTGKEREGIMSTEIYVLDGERYLLSVTTDITERLKLEEEMARLDRLDLIGQMAAGIAHEIRNPMTTVRGFLQMLGERPQYQDQYEIFQLMVSELDRANSIITEFLTLSKSSKLEVKTNNLNNVLKTLFPLIQADAFNSKKDVLLDLGDIPDFPFDEREICQLILNLARNGLEAMTVDQTLVLRTYQRPRQIVLEVEDQGCGIPPAVLQKLGTPFYTTKENGTGLGLAICYRIAQKHQAKIKVKSSSKGTTFRVSFPI